MRTDRGRTYLVLSVPFLIIFIGILICVFAGNNSILVLLGEFVILVGILVVNALIILLIYRGSIEMLVNR